MNPITAQPPTVPGRFQSPSLNPAGSGDPSFRIRPVDTPGSSSSGALQAGSLRLDRINSAELLRRSRRIYFRFLESCPTAPEPMGVVLLGEGPAGRVVFELPVLLPAEQFVPIDLLRPRPARSRGGRGIPARPPS
ncbi:MAG: hypothetical protein ER33_03860 [Cyanobium sp. CACIAM 14]|nr:MAG: hypothetical protein ER33_03860 [Cyanobium sp. CACIAM 14]